MVYLVGAGPGDPGLITVRGLDCIRSADVLVYDRLVSPALVAQSRPEAEKIYVGKEVGRHGRKQADINRLVADRALDGKVVCRLKGGDPFVFGRGGEEAALLAELGVPFEVVPGITSGIAAPAYAGIPVTHRDFAGSVTLVTGHDAPRKRGPAVDWGHLATGSETLLIYMGAEGLADTALRLIGHGRRPDTPVAVIRWGTRAEQQTVTGTLATIADVVREAGIKSPAMIVVGEVVTLREQLNWAELKPLFGHRVLVPTLGASVAPDLVEPLRRAGAEIWEWPVGAVADPVAWAPLDAAIAQLHGYDSLFVADADAVRRFIRRLMGSGRDMRSLFHLRVMAGGLAVAEALSAVGIRVDEVPPAGGERVLVIGADQAVAAAAATLREQGAVAVEAPTHRYAPRMDTADLLAGALAAGEIQSVVLPSPEVAPLLFEVAGGAQALEGLLTEHEVAVAAL